MLTAKHNVIRFEGFAVDRSLWQVYWRQEPVAINRKSFDLLLYLIDHHERVIGKDELMDSLWPGQFVEEGNLTQHIFLLRKALSRHLSGKKIIETIHRRGYRFVLPIEMDAPDKDRAVESLPVTDPINKENNIDADADKPAESEASYTAPAEQRLYLWTVSFALASALALAGWLGWEHWLHHHSAPPAVLLPFEGSNAVSYMAPGYFSAGFAPA